MALGAISSADLRSHPLLTCLQDAPSTSSRAKIRASILGLLRRAPRCLPVAGALLDAFPARTSELRTCAWRTTAPHSRCQFPELFLPRVATAVLLATNSSARAFSRWT